MSSVKRKRNEQNSIGKKIRISVIRQTPKYKDVIRQTSKYKGVIMQVAKHKRDISQRGFGKIDMGNNSQDILLEPEKSKNMDNTNIIKEQNGKSEEQRLEPEKSKNTDNTVEETNDKGQEQRLEPKRVRTLIIIMQIKNRD